MRPSSPSGAASGLSLPSGLGRLVSLVSGAFLWSSNGARLASGLVLAAFRLLRSVRRRWIAPILLRQALLPVFRYRRVLEEYWFLLFPARFWSSNRSRISIRSCSSSVQVAPLC